MNKLSKNDLVFLKNEYVLLKNELVLFIYLFVLIYKPGETIQCAALFSHGTQVAMFSQKCRAGISISKTGMRRDPKRKKKHKNIVLLKNELVLLNMSVRVRVATQLFFSGKMTLMSRFFSDK